LNKTILITGSTDGIGFATAASLLKLGHTVILHGRNEQKLAKVKEQLSSLYGVENIFAYQADLSVLSDVKKLAAEVQANHPKLDVLINNAGVFIVPDSISEDGLDTRFMVNTIAPFLLTTLLMPLLDKDSRVVNLSSAAQAPMRPEELLKTSLLSDSEVYAKSKLALTMWSRQMALTLGNEGPIVVAVNPKSFLGSKMVEQAYGVQGSDLQMGADILVRAALSDEFSYATGLYFDNDIGQFTSPHPDGVDEKKIMQLTQTLETIVA